jgi:putative nucleotidyltransferase with HDIG domain
MSSNVVSGVSGGWALHRSVTLLRVFLLASALILVTGGTVLAWLLTTSARDEALDERSANLTEYVDGVLRSELVRGESIHVSPRLPLRIKAQLRRQPEILSVKVWRADGTLVWTSRAPERIGRRFVEAGEGDLGATIATGQPHASLGKLGEDEDAAESALESGGLFEVYAPIKNIDGTRVLGVYEIYADATRTESFISARKRVIWLAVFAVFATLYAALALLVKGASALMRRQAAALRTRSRELMESYRKLEESSLEAVESLNATVDAKDPYTAGHSARVQRIALAVAEELGLPSERLDAVRFGGLFHDIGKIGVPDRILSKSGTLDEDEYEAIKRHPADGAEIVSHFSRLREAVPLIRHHHERWDGNGYPDRLAGTAIPTEACVVGLADAWDAMTTDRPYRRALTIEEASAEVRRCRGTQFSPAVVDAFFGASRKQPSVFEADEPASFDIAATG